ncbi:aldehyde-alcohol dehydrogenase [Mycobacterium marinum]|uniref:bifunctional acetaldehyde-CoA/alcohol dehydrogenase n=1 Tax=Mycobacterium marinum TaxID=1781 RepID=UPI0021C3C89F|nr:bifunctional acetaldehyde-CoA/alcohol dehydrogenase [Mycobacterium marinum]GJO01729.1 aldehyde-alcohol dehydrogenase [Mycobacterium marinum]GJO09618.1 aldehyde-alcohol dehydrogenase [Mycobacterium marinum]GJO10559.1 aldehyde-alcohol dehydrogenase [Mycobacterium marinum]GJO19182.1 aldehyde-alcohol dehydrogenase [Mycobacterium marinum]GJO31935.1 aldehyde-alcohol dehydrogenase [Mycobacterium marinum]
MTTTPTESASPVEAPAIDNLRTAEIDAIVDTAAEAARAFRKLDQQQVDAIVEAMVRAGVRAAGELAGVAIEETGFGVFEDKVVKNYVATEFLHDYLRDKKSVGVIDEDVEHNIVYVAEPIGVVLGITPVTNPTSTVLFKAIVAAKTRNAILFRPSPYAVRCCERSIEILRTAAEAAGMPPGALQVIPDAAHEVTHYLFTHPKVDFIWVTGGPKIVALANSAGKPGLSVGPGNAPIYIHKTADLKGAVVEILISKTFDSSVICPAEQTCIIDDEIYDEMIAEFERMGAQLLTADQAKAVADFAFGCGDKVSLDAVGQKAPELAARAGFSVPPTVKVLLAQLPSDLDELAAHPLVQEKLMPVLGVVRARSVQHGIDAAVLVTEHGGLGHTSAIYANDDVIEAYGLAVRTGRILVNAPTAVGALGGVYNNLTPTFSLGCGTWGGSSTTENVNYRQLLNIKTVSRRRTPPQWFRVPSNTYFNEGALDNLRELDCETVVVVTDALTEERGVVEALRGKLRAQHVQVFSEVTPEPDETTIRRGVALMQRVQPDLLIAIGGGSVLDAGKAMRLFYEHPEKSLDALTMPFLDPRKRVADYPTDRHRIQLVAVPTTSGTGSEVSPAAVLTVGGKKETLVDYSLVPDLAIVDPVLTSSMPQKLTADTGIDALTHALEAIVSIFASPYTDALCAQAVRLIFDALPRAYDDPDDLSARTSMSNAATLAGLAFSNAFVGTNHALAHAVGAKFSVPHGRANGIFLPHVLRYNASLPTKFMPAPGYSAYIAPDKYAQLGQLVFGGHLPDDSRQRLFAGVDDLLDRLDMPRSLREFGVDEQEFLAALPTLAMTAFEDLSNRTNPRMPLVSEITDLLRLGYYGDTGVGEPAPAPIKPGDVDGRSV